ncbi:Glutamyl-tRNA(Gln) amidotransferase subunit A [uncultured Gammaproteobacteria bacterium]
MPNLEAIQPIVAMSQLLDLTLAQARQGLLSRDFSARDLTQAYLDQMAATRALNAYITETPDRALADADHADQRLAKGEARPLEGLPIAVKDLYCTKGVRTTAASNILGNFVPPYESTVSQKVWDAGGVMLGKANMDEFAMGSATVSSAFGPTKNPLKRKGDDRDLVPGGSSGGSAAAVAARSALAALGSDTGGSIRQPASFCGITGIKPTYGRCSRWGMIAYASSLDQAGPITRTVRDSAIILHEIAGYDPKDSTSVDRPVPDYEAFIGQSVKGKRIGVPKEYRLDGLRADVLGMWDHGAQILRDAGAEVVEVSLPMSKYALAAYYIIAMAEASSNLSRYDGVRFGQRVDGESLIEMYENTRSAGFGAEVKRRIMIGTFVLSAGYYDAYYRKAQQVRRRIADDFNAALAGVDALIFPTSPIPAFAIGEKMDDPVAMYLIDVFTITVNLAGLPGISVPVGTSEEGLPLGLQVVGRPFDEGNVLAVAEVLERGSGRV